MTDLDSNRSMLRALTLGMSTLAMAVAVSAHAAEAVYTETNSVRGNEILGFSRLADGTMALTSRTSTHGTGLDFGLGSQGALAFDDNHHYLYAVDAGSDDIAVFEALDTAPLRYVTKVYSGGSKPVSLTVHGDRLFVLNAGGFGNIAGFHIGCQGALQPLADSIRPLSSSSAAGAQVSFDREGRLLVVTEKITNKIDLYNVSGSVPIGPHVIASSGHTPFGFAFDQGNHLLVSEAFSGAHNASALSSYAINYYAPSLAAVTASLATKQTAACWVAIGRHGAYAYTANTEGDTISGFRIASNGSLSLLNASGVSGYPGSGSGTTDLAVSQDQARLFGLSTGFGKIEEFNINSDGSLTRGASAIDVPANATGLAVR